MTDEEFRKEAIAVIKRAMLFTTIARKEGLLALEEKIDRKKAGEHDVFECGMALVLESSEEERVEKVLSDIIGQEKDETSKTLKTIQKEAVMSIRNGRNAKWLADRLNTYAGFPPDDPEFVKIIDEVKAGQY